MILNVETCKVMHFGKFNPKAIYSMADDSWNEKDIEKLDKKGTWVLLVSIMSEYLKLSGNVVRIVGKANRILGMLKRTFKSRELGFRTICTFLW